jgi:CheY-like chemotaxis protein
MTRELLPDIVVLDIGMPVLNGIEAAKQYSARFAHFKDYFSHAEQ